MIASLSAEPAAPPEVPVPVPPVAPAGLFEQLMIQLAPSQIPTNSSLEPPPPAQPIQIPGSPAILIAPPPDAQPTDPTPPPVPAPGMSLPPVPPEDKEPALPNAAHPTREIECAPPPTPQLPPLPTAIQPPGTGRATLSPGSGALPGVPSELVPAQNPAAQAATQQTGPTTPRPVAEEKVREPQAPDPTRTSVASLGLASLSSTEPPVAALLEVTAASAPNDPGLPGRQTKPDPFQISNGPKPVAPIRVQTPGPRPCPESATSDTPGGNRTPVAPALPHFTAPGDERAPVPEFMAGNSATAKSLPNPGPPENGLEAPNVPHVACYGSVVQSAKLDSAKSLPAFNGKFLPQPAPVQANSPGPIPANQTTSSTTSSASVAGPLLRPTSSATGGTSSDWPVLLDFSAVSSATQALRTSSETGAKAVPASPKPSDGIAVANQPNRMKAPELSEAANTAAESIELAPAAPLDSGRKPAAVEKSLDPQRLEVTPAVFDAPPSGSASAPDPVAKPAAEPLEKFLFLLNQEIAHVRHSSPDALSIVLKPDSQTQLFIQLVRHDGATEAFVRFDRGDAALFQQHWPQLQQSLAQQNVRLAPLRESEFASSGQALGSGAQFEHGRQAPSRPDRADDLAWVGSRTEPIKRRSAKAPGSAHHGWEWWA